MSGLSSFVEKRHHDDTTRKRRQVLGDQKRVAVPPTRFSRNVSAAREETLTVPPLAPTPPPLVPEPLSRRQTYGFDTGSESIDDSTTSSFLPKINYSSKITQGQFANNSIAYRASAGSENIGEYTRHQLEEAGLSDDEVAVPHSDDEASGETDTAADSRHQNVLRGLVTNTQSDEFINYKKRNLLNKNFFQASHPSQERATDPRLAPSSHALFITAGEKIRTSSRSPTPSHEVTDHNILDSESSDENEPIAQNSSEIAQPTLKRKPSLDHNSDQLQLMAFRDLLNEPFDGISTRIPSLTVSQGQPGLVAPPLRATLEEISSRDHSQESYTQHHSFFEELPLGQYLECGEIIAEHLNATISNLSRIRQEKRKMVGNFEAEIVRREMTVRGRVEALKRKKGVMTRQTEELTSKRAATETEVGE